MTAAFEPSIQLRDWEHRAISDIDGGDTIRFIIGPADYQWIDVSLDGEGGIEIMAGRGVHIVPKVTNHIVVTVPQ
jgi:hypothetical protein